VLTRLSVVDHTLAKHSGTRLRQPCKLTSRSPALEGFLNSLLGVGAEWKATMQVRLVTRIGLS
jgi:hypothetical protein